MNRWTKTKRANINDKMLTINKTRPVITLIINGLNTNSIDSQYWIR